MRNAANDTASVVGQQIFDYREVAAEDRGFVKERAELIRETAKRTAQGIVKIGEWLSEVKERLAHGKWLEWLRSEFAWSDFTAKAFMRVYREFKSENFSDLHIDISALYLIAAPKTPEPVRQEVIARAQSGEPITRAKALEVLESYKKQVELPPPSVARQIAIATGVPTAASNNTYILPMSAEAERALGDEQAKIRGLYNAMEQLANPGITAAEMVVLGKKHFCRDLGPRAVRAAAWLTLIAEEFRKSA